MNMHEGKGLVADLLFLSLWLRIKFKCLKICLEHYN